MRAAGATRPHRGLAARASVVLALVLLGALPARAQPQAGDHGAVRWRDQADAPITVQAVLDAPAELRTLLQQHVRLLRRGAQPLPIDEADRLALTRRTRGEIADLLATEGYFSPRVRFDRSVPGQWTVAVEPGPRAVVRSVDIRFEGEVVRAAPPSRGGVSADQLRSAWTLPVGAPFRQAAWDEAKAQLLDALGATRYAAARISQSRAEIDPDGASAHLSLTLDSGPAFYLGELEVEGVHDLPADLVARYSQLRPGDPYEREALLAFQSGLQNTPHFGSVIVDIERAPALAAAVPVRVQVTEALPRRVGFGAGYSTNTGARVEASYRDSNLWRRGWDFSTGLRLEQRRQALFGDVFLPPSGRHRDSVGAALEASNLEGLDVTTQAVGVARTVVRGNIETQFALRLQHERIVPDGAPASSANTLTANWKWLQRAVDSVFDPRHGTVLELQLGGGTALAVAEQDFVRGYVRMVRYQPVRRSDVLILRAEAGATVADSRDGIPQDFLFRAGGSQSVRGYDYQSLGVSEGSATVGGRYLGTLSAEYVNWFSPEWGAALFVDAGDAADAWQELRLRSGVGVGARWRSPAGPLAVDLAYGRDAGTIQLHFGVGIAF